nr:TPA_asm: FtsK [Megastigmus wasp adintovirus]
MDFKQQSLKLPVVNFDMLTESKFREKKKRHGELLPDSIRAVFCGPSNCGKTNALLALITHPNGLKFENIYVYSKSLNQPKYQFLKTLIEPIEGVNYLPFSEHDLVISPDKAHENSIMIFDDIACEKQDNVKAFYCMGRHKCVDCFYLCQSYAQVPKHLVRDNVNLLIVFRQDDMNLKHIYNDHVNTDMLYQRFKDLCGSCWNDNHGFLVIDKDRDINNGRYRKGFDQYIINVQQSA